MVCHWGKAPPYKTRMCFTRAFPESFLNNMHWHAECILSLQDPRSSNMYRGVPLRESSSVQEAHMFYKNVSYFWTKRIGTLNVSGLHYYVHKESLVLWGKGGISCFQISSRSRPDLVQISSKTPIIKIINYIKLLQGECWGLKTKL